MRLLSLCFCFRSMARPALLLLTLMLSIGPARGVGNGGVGGGAVSLPGGPGSFEGFGDGFQPSMSTGTGKHSVPLAAVVGAGGMAPHLSLEYEGGGGNGVLGLGWSLTSASIHRKTEKGLPRYIDGPNGVDDDLDGEIDDPQELDVFVEPSGEDLMPVLQEGVTNYFAVVEGGFVRYRRVGSGWEAADPTGRRMIFGESAAARIADPENPEHVFEWLLEREVDTHGNTLVYEYSGFPGSPNVNARYLTAVRYGAGGAPWENYHFVALTYEDRPDWFEQCHAGFPVRMGKRLSRVDVGTHGPQIAGHLQADLDHDGKVDNLTRRYLIGYDPDSFRSLITTITQVGMDGLTSYPPHRFRYTSTTNHRDYSAEGQWMQSLGEPPSTFEDPFVDLVDLNGDGLPDLLRTQQAAGGHTGYLNQGQIGSDPGSIQWAAGQEVAAGNDGLAWNASLESSQVHLADIDGDGLPDLVEDGIGVVYYYRNTPGFGQEQLAWGDRSLLATQDFQPPAPAGDPDVRTADINFDKRIDIFKSVKVGDSVAYQVWFNLGKQRYSSRATSIPVNGYLLSDPGVEVADLNGDRVPDITRIRANGILVTAGLGYGRFLPETLIAYPSGEVLSDEQIGRSHLEDVNGDGLADLVLERPEPGVLWFWLNRGNYTLEERRTIFGLPAAVGNQRWRWADMNGNGTVDLVIADDGTIPHLQVLDIGKLLGCVPRPYLLLEMNNGLGAVTRLEYRSSADYMIEDGIDPSGNYRYPWSHAMPFPVEVVSREWVSDSLGNTNETRFLYHDPYYDPVEKQFRGFARAERITVGGPDTPSLVTRYFFDVGATTRALKGKLLRSSSEQEDGKVFQTTEMEWGVHEFLTGIYGDISTWVAPDRVISTQVELGSAPPKRLEVEYEYDGFGNRTVERQWGVVENGDRAAGNDERVLQTQFAYNTNAWLLRFPVREETLALDGSVIARTDHFYDDETFSGSNAGVVSKGDETLVRRWHDLADAKGFVRSHRARYDNYGNSVSVLDPLGEPGRPDLGHGRDFVYDERFHQYAVREIQHIGSGHADLEVSARFDEALGVTTENTDANGLVTYSYFDALGRVVAEVEPGDSVEFPTRQFRYAEALPFGRSGVISYTETLQLDKPPGSLPGASHDAYYHIGRSYVDGLGRTRLVKSEAEADPETGASRFVTTSAMLLNAKGGARAMFPAYFSATLDYEDPEAAGWLGRFHRDGKTVLLGIQEAPTVRYYYDALGRATRAVRPDGSFAETRFEPLVTKSFDENATDPQSPHFGKHSVTRQDGLGRAVEVDEVVKLTDDGVAASETVIWPTRYRFREDDSLLSITDSQGNVKSMSYDAMGRLRRLSDWDRGVIQIAYDEASNRTERQDAKGQRIRYTYDGANRLLAEDYQEAGSPGFNYGPGVEVSYSYDELPEPVDFGDGTSGQATHLRSRLARVRDTQGETTYSYDERGRILWEVRRLPDPMHQQPVSFRTTYDHDSMGRLTRLTYPDKDFVTFQYNDRTRLWRIMGGPNSAILADRHYTPSGQDEFTLFGNGVLSRSGYDSRLRMVSAQTGPQTEGARSYSAYRYRFDAASNLRGIEDVRSGVEIEEGNPRRNTQSFDYDDLYRLTGFQVSHAAPGNVARSDGGIRYQYDRIGNLLSQTSDWKQVERGWPTVDLGELSYGGSGGRSGRTGPVAGQPGPHALSRLSRDGAQRDFQYDANGNMLKLGGVASFVWDFNDHLVEYSDAAGRSEYRYDHSGRRVSKRVFAPNSTNLPSSTTLYVSRAFEIRPNNEVVKYVFDEGRRLAQISGRLNPGTQLDWVRLFAGWNLAASRVAVADPKGVVLSGNGGQAQVDAVRWWNPQTADLEELPKGATAPAGSVFWIHARQAGTVTFAGTDTLASVPALRSSGFWGQTAFRALDPSSIFTPDDFLWVYDAASGRWISWDGLAGSNPTNTSQIRPGEVVFVSRSSGTPIDPKLFEPRIRYYHDDHLGSQSVITDAAGELAEELTYFPFGQIRNHHTPAGDTVPYGFGGKERDSESGLHQFEARYLLAGLGRFISADPSEQAGNPQGLNGYAYVENRPMSFGDPTGLVRAKLKEIRDEYKSEQYTSSEARSEANPRVIKFSKDELSNMRVVLNKQGLLVYKKSGRLLDTSEGRGMFGPPGVVSQEAFIFVQTKNGKLYATRGEQGKVHHSSFTGGKAVRMAGEIQVQRGRIRGVNNKSGHYRPEQEFLNQFHGWLSRKKADLSNAVITREVFRNRMSPNRAVGGRGALRTTLQSQVSQAVEHVATLGRGDGYGVRVYLSRGGDGDYNATVENEEPAYNATVENEEPAYNATVENEEGAYNATVDSSPE